MKPERVISKEERGAIAKMVVALFDHWQLSTEEQLGVLGLSINNRRLLYQYRKGEPLASNRDLLERVGIILDIHKGLRLLFPGNKELSYAWIKTRNKAFGGMPPVEIVTEHGFPGLLMVRCHLEGARGR